MNYFDLYSSYPDRTIAAAWDSQVKEADNNPWLACTLTECGGELFARFAACYAELRALPRSARRALQRRLARSGELAEILPEYLQQGGRRLQHRMAWSLAGAALLLALGQGVATAATITVTTNDPRIVPDGQCSLVEAIVNANNDAATFPDCAAGSGPDTIVLPANAKVMLSNSYVTSYNTRFGTTVSRPAGLPRITSQITIEGNGATIVRQGNAPAFGLIDVRGNFDLLGSRVTPGDLTLQSVTLSGGSSFGGLYSSFGGTVSIENSIVSGNTGSGVSNNGTLTVERSTISGNTGSGVSNGGTLNIENSTISGNTDGGVSNGGTLTIENSTISGNTSNGAGGGVYNYGGRLAISNSTISGNRANHGGGVSNSVDYYGAPGTLTLSNSLIAGNQAAVAPEIENVGSSILTANNFNLFGSNGNAGVTGFSPGPTDIVPSVSLAQILGPLKFNGGPTQTHALLPGSPAIDAGDSGGCRNNLGTLLSTDQRGFDRHVDGNFDGTVRCDIGAVEFAAEHGGPYLDGQAHYVDLNGDGKADLIFQGLDNLFWVSLSTGAGFTTPAPWVQHGGGVLIGQAQYADLNGDGKADLIFQGLDNLFWVTLSTGTGFTEPTLWVQHGGEFLDGQAQYVDLNGDGKADLIFQGLDNLFWVSLSTGAGFTEPTLWVQHGGEFLDGQAQYADLNGDGKADLIFQGWDNTFWVSLSTGTSFTSPVPEL